MAPSPTLQVVEVGVQDGGLGADLGVDQRCVCGPTIGAGADRGGAAQAGAGLDPRVGGDLDVGVDPGRGGVDDRHPGEHVGLEQAAARLGLDLGELDAVVDPHRHREVVGEVGGDARPAARSAVKTSGR